MNHKTQTRIHHTVSELRLISVALGNNKIAKLPMIERLNAAQACLPKSRRRTFVGNGQAARTLERIEQTADGEATSTQLAQSPAYPAAKQMKTVIVQVGTLNLKRGTYILEVI